VAVTDIKVEVGGFPDEIRVLDGQLNVYGLNELSEIDLDCTFTRIIRETGASDILINNAAISKVALLEEIT